MGIVSHVHVEGICNPDGIRGGQVEQQEGQF